MNFIATYYSDGTAVGSDYNYNRTGYTIRKWAHQEDCRTWDSNVKNEILSYFSLCRSF